MSIFWIYEWVNKCVLRLDLVAAIAATAAAAAGELVIKGGICMHACRAAETIVLAFGSAWMPVFVCRVGSHVGVGGCGDICAGGEESLWLMIGWKLLIENVLAVRSALLLIY